MNIEDATIESLHRWSQIFLCISFILGALVAIIPFFQFYIKRHKERLEWFNAILGILVMSVCYCQYYFGGKIQERKGIQEIFQATVIAAHNDNRNAFDQLNKWGLDKSFPYHVLASQAYNEVYYEHCNSNRNVYKVPWKTDPSSAGLEALTDFYWHKVPPGIKPGLIQFISENEKFPLKNKMEFFIEVISRDESLRAVEYAGLSFRDGAKLDKCPLDIDFFKSWWEKHKDNFQEPVK